MGLRNVHPLAPAKFLRMLPCEGRVRCRRQGLRRGSKLSAAIRVELKDANCAWISAAEENYPLRNGIGSFPAIPLADFGAAQPPRSGSGDRPLFHPLPTYRSAGARSEMGQSWPSQARGVNDPFGVRYRQFESA